MPTIIHGSHRTHSLLALYYSLQQLATVVHYLENINIACSWPSMQQFHSMVPNHNLHYQILKQKHNISLINEK
jgi:hypothetical protein